MNSFSVTKYVFVILLISFLILGMGNNVNAERFFQSHSTWYEPIPPNPTLYPNSDKYVADIAINSSSIYTYSGDNPPYEYSVPVFHAKINTPVTSVLIDGCETGKETSCASLDLFILENNWNDVPIPSGALPAGNSSSCAGNYMDGHMVVISYDGNTAWDFYRAKKCGSDPWKAILVRKWDLTSDGVNYPHDNHGSARVARVPLLHGLVTYNEVKNEEKIDHALAFCYASAKSWPGEEGVYPHYGQVSGANTREWPLKVGMRLYLDESVTCSDYGFNTLNTKVCEAMKEYGMFFIENPGSGSNCIYLESLINNPDKSWSGEYTPGTLSGLPLNKLRIIEPLIPNPEMFDFSLSNSGNKTIRQGESGFSTITAALISGVESIDFSVSGLPEDVTADFSKISCAPTCSSILTFTATPSAIPNSYSITVTGTGGGKSKVSDFTLTILDSSAQNPTDNYTYIVNVDPDGTYLDTENFTNTITQGESAFLLNYDMSDYAGSGYLQTSGEKVWTCSDVYEGKAYQAYFSDIGLYNVWIRGYGADHSSNSIFIGIDGTCVGALNVNDLSSQWIWTNSIRSGSGVNTIDVTTPGIHAVNIWVREPNFLIDGIYLTQGTEAPPEDITLLDSIPPAPPVGLVIE